MANDVEQKGIWADVIRTASNLFRSKELPPADMREIEERMQTLMKTTDLSGAILPGIGMLKPLAMGKALQSGIKTARESGGPGTPGYKYTLKALARLFEGMKALPQEAYKGIKKVAFPRATELTGFGPYRGLVRKLPELGLDIRVRAGEASTIQRTLFHEMAHVGQYGKEAVKDVPMLAMKKARKKLFRDVQTGKRRWKDVWSEDPTEIHAMDFADEIADYLKTTGRKEVPKDIYKGLLEKTVPLEFREVIRKVIDEGVSIDIFARPKGLPPFRGTEAAVEFGEKHFGKQKVIELLKRAQEGSAAKATEIRRKPWTMETAQEAIEESTTGQFYREALEVATGKFSKKLGGRRLPDLKRWESGFEPLAAIPGEPIAFLDAGRNLRGAKAHVTFTESGKYLAKRPDGTVIKPAGGNGKSEFFKTLEEAQMAAEDWIGKGK